jgi:3-hydroxyisobutyrate dehydrogenase-like beta-hydroxyacid dehydrogenase
MTSGEREVVVIGVGRMGLPICLRLLELGYSVSATDTSVASAAAVQEGRRSLDRL